ncbi:helix-turn-helix domain-containing protein [bacterium BMS3Abin03]|nr:helix-turn-helix domain-containing protein [bacterium BMS3Abin03]MCG6960273.1 helix-turn-helix domain-containing protein [bacterium BMS3Abin03]
MKHITIVVTKGAILGNIEGPRQVFTEVNESLARIGRPPLFKIQLVGLSKESQLNDGLYTISTDLFSEVKKTDLIIIPAMYGNLQKAVEQNKEFIPWIIKHYKAGAEVASLCLGAFLLASTGLLEGRKCATHWLAANEFRKMFPDVNLVEDKIITDENGIYSSGGAYSSLNFILYLVEKFAGREAAVFCSKAFQIDIQRDSQSPFTIFIGQKDHEDDSVKKAQEFIETNFKNKITVDQLASMLGLSRRNLERRFKKATANTVVEYIQRVKVEAAKQSLESSRENVNEVMYNVGYSDPKAFRTTFKKITGLSPIQYRNRYNREIAF